MNIVDSILAQSQAGSANGAGFGDWFVKGRQLANQDREAGQQQQKIDLEKAQFQAQQQLAPAHQTLLEQKVQMGKLQIDQTLQDRQDEIDNTRDFSELSSMVGDLLGDGQPQGALSETLKAISKRPALAKDPRVAGLLKDVQTSAGMGKLAAQLDMARQRTDILQQKADTADAAQVDLSKSRADNLALKTQAQGDLEKYRAGSLALREKGQQQRFALVGMVANQVLEKSVSHAINAEIKAVSDDMSLSAATKHRKIDDIITNWQKKRPEAFTPQARSVLATTIAHATPDAGDTAQLAPAVPSSALTPTHTFDPDTGAIIPVPAPVER